MLPVCAHCSILPAHTAQDFILPSSFLRRIFFMDFSIGDRLFYTRSNGVRVPATVVGTAKDGLSHLEYYQDALKGVKRQCEMESTSFAIPRSDSPPHCPPSPPSNTEPSAPEKPQVLHHWHPPSRTPTPPLSPQVEDQHEDDVEALP